MATLIGDGSHAQDIAHYLPAPERWVRVTHHTEYDGNGPYIIGVNDPRLRNKIRDQFDHPDLPWHHPSIWVEPTVEWGYGTHINYGVTMTRTLIGHHCTISPGVTICGDVTISDRVLIGAGATICDRVTIGSDVTIGAGAVVLPETNIPDGETWVGVPAKRVHP